MAAVSLRAYAKHRGVTLKAVQKAIESGRIRTNADGKLDTDRADADWARNTGPKVKRTAATVAAGCTTNGTAAAGTGWRRARLCDGAGDHRQL